MSRGRGVLFPAQAAARGWLNSVRARLQLGALCDCPRHLPAASGYDGCTCAAVNDVDPECPDVRRLRIDVYPVVGGGWAVPCGPLELPIQAQADLMAGRAFVDLPARLT